jgi:outer membrane protein TolC
MIVLVAALALGCQPAPTAQPMLDLTLKRAVAIAIAPDGNTRVQLVEEGIRQAEARQQQARSALLPTVDGSVITQSFTRNLGAFGIQFPAVPGLSFPALVGPVDTLDARGSASWSLLDMSARRRYQSAKAGVETARLEAGATREAVTDQVARAYLAALRAEASRETAEANVALARALVSLAEAQKDAGTGTAIDVTRARVQLANDQQRLIVAANEVDRARLQLLRVMGLSLDVRIQLSERLEKLPAEARDLEAALAAARESRSDLQAQAKREETARLQYSAAQWQSAPSVAAFGDYGTIGLVGGSQLPTRAVGASLRIPVFDSGRRAAQRQEALSQLRSEQIRTSDLRKQAELEVRLALDAIQAAEAQIEAAEEGLKLAENEVAQARRRFEAGVTTSVEVTDAQTRLQRARENRIHALFQYNLARIDLASATGKIQEFVNR